jgi:hypothetical protein
MEPPPPAEPAAPAEPAEPAVEISQSVFSPVVERVVTNSLNLGTGELDGIPWFDAVKIGHSPDIGVLDQKVELLRKQSADVFTDESNVLFGIDLKTIAVDSAVWETEVPPARLADNLAVVDRNNLHALTPSSGSINPPFTYLIETRKGLMGILQITGFTENPPGVNVRYKLVRQTSANQNNPPAPETLKKLREALNDRLDAASNMNNAAEKDKPLAAVATDAAKAGEVEIVAQALGQMFSLSKRDDTTREAALLLAKRGLRKQAIEIAKGINNFKTRDQTLSELAQ